MAVHSKAIGASVVRNFLLESWLQKSDFDTFWQLTKYNRFFWTCWFVTQNRSNFVSLPLKNDSPYYHKVQGSIQVSSITLMQECKVGLSPNEVRLRVSICIRWKEPKTWRRSLSQGIQKRTCQAPAQYVKGQEILKVNCLVFIFSRKRTKFFLNFDLSK